MDPTKGTLAEMRIGESAPVASLTGKPCRLSLFDADGTAIAQTEGPISRFAPGKTGCTIAATFHHSLHLELRAPVQAGKAGEATLALALAGREPREVWRGIDLRRAISEAVTAQVHVDGIPYFTAQLDAAVPDEDQRSLSALADAARDLDVVQDRTGTIFAMPDEIDDMERVWLRILRIILDGGIAPLPRSSVQGRTHPGATVPPDGELHAALVDYRSGLVELFGRTLNLGGPLFYYHPYARTEVLDAEPDNSGCYPFRMTSSDETVFVGYIAGRVTTTTVITPWSVEGIKEPETPTLPVGAG